MIRKEPTHHAHQSAHSTASGSGSTRHLGLNIVMQSKLKIALSRSVDKISLTLSIISVIGIRKGIISRYQQTRGFEQESIQLHLQDLLMISVNQKLSMTYSRWAVSFERNRQHKSRVEEDSRFPAALTTSCCPPPLVV
jgi:hypothetical protein